MAERFLQDDRIIEGLAREKGFSPKMGFDFRMEDLINFGSKENPNTGSNKRRRGNDSDSNAAQADDDLPAESVVTVTGRRRGRPLGSKNKPKVPSIGIHEISDTMKTHVLDVPAGFDVIDILETFLRGRQSEVVVMSGKGKVTAVTLRQPVAVGRIAHDSRLFEIVSLGGAFPRGADAQGGTGLQVSLTDAQGRIVTGTVKSMIAHGSVLLTVGTKMVLEWQGLNVKPRQRLEQFHSPSAKPAQQHFQLPTPMTVQQQVGMMPTNNTVPNLEVGSARSNTHDISPAAQFSRF